METALTTGFQRIGRWLEPWVFAHRRRALALLALLTLFLGWQALQLPLDAAFDRAEPFGHHAFARAADVRDRLDGDNPVRIAVLRRGGTIYDRMFLTRLKALTDGVAALPGLDRRHLRSLFSPGLRHVEVSESRYFGVRVVPEDFDPEHASRAELAALRDRVTRAGLAGWLVTDDHRGALIEAAWLAGDPATGERYPQRALAQALEDVVRAAETAGGGDFRIHVLGAPVLAEALAAEAKAALLYSVLTFLAVAALLVFALASLRVALLAVLSLAVAMIWQLGLLHLAGIALDPDAAWAMAIAATAGLVAVAQFGLRWLQVGAEGGRAGFEASLETWRELSGPLSVGLATAAAAALALAAVSVVPLTRQVAIVAAIGIAAWLPIVGLALPVLLSAIGTSRIRWRLADGVDDRLAALAGLSRPAVGVAMLIAIGALCGFSIWQQRGQPVEPAGADLARLSPDNPVRIDAQRVAAAFPHTVHSLRVVIDAPAQACTDPATLEQLDQLAWQLENLPGVTTVTALPQALKRVLSAFGDGSPKFRALARQPDTLTQAMAPIDDQSGLHAGNCTWLPVTVQLARRDAALLAAVAREVGRFNARNRAEFVVLRPKADLAACDAAQGTARPDCPVVARIAGGPLGLALARQSAVAEALLPSSSAVLAVLGIGGTLLLGDALAMLAVLLPLAFAGWLALGLIATSGAALTLLTLPLWLSAVIAGFGSYLLVVRAARAAIRTGLPVPAALRSALRVDGRPLLVMLVTAAGFALWIMAGYPAQRGVGKWLAISAATIGVVGITVLPALIALLLGGRPPVAGQSGSAPGVR